MIRLRPYLDIDAERILSWQRDEESFYKWSAGMLGSYPPNRKQFDRLGALMRFTALDENEPVGFFTLRNPGESLEEVRFGYVVVDPEKRGRGFGRQMLLLGLIYARYIYRASRASLGVFEHNEPAVRCYLAAGFRDTGKRELYTLKGESWTCIEMEADLRDGADLSGCR